MSLQLNLNVIKQALAVALEQAANYSPNEIPPHLKAAIEKWQKIIPLLEKDLEKEASHSANSDVSDIIFKVNTPPGLPGLGNPDISNGNKFYLFTNTPEPLKNESSNLATPDENSDFYTKGLHYFKLAEYHKALNMLNMAESNNTAEKSHHIYYIRAICYNNLGLPTEAMKDFERVIELEPNFGSAYLQRGLIYLGMQNKVAAQEDFRRANQLGIKLPQIAQELL